MINLFVRLRTIPQDRFVFNEAIRMGEIDVRDAFSNFIVDGEILVDNDELKKVSAIPEVAASLQQVTAPQTKQYKPTDWRAKQVVMRDVQWQQRPVIEYIANTYKQDIIQAFKSKLKIPNDWINALLHNAKYVIDPKALQLSPTTDKKWKSVFVSLISDLGSSEGGGIIGKFASEFKQAMDNGAIQRNGNQYQFQSSLTGFDSTLKTLDPYSGAKLSSTKKHGWDIADEPGYDKEIRNAFIDHFSDVIDAHYPNARVLNVDDNGIVRFTADEPIEDESTPDTY